MTDSCSGRMEEDAIATCGQHMDCDSFSNWWDYDPFESMQPEGAFAPEGFQAVIDDDLLDVHCPRSCRAPKRANARSFSWTGGTAPLPPPTPGGVAHKARAYSSTDPPAGTMHAPAAGCVGASEWDVARALEGFVCADTSGIESGHPYGGPRGHVCPDAMTRSPAHPVSMSQLPDATMPFDAAASPLLAALHYTDAPIVPVVPTPKRGMPPRCPSERAGHGRTMGDASAGGYSRSVATSYERSSFDSGACPNGRAGYTSGHLSEASVASPMCASALAMTSARTCAPSSLGNTPACAAAAAPPGGSASAAAALGAAAARHFAAAPAPAPAPPLPESAAAAAAAAVDDAAGAAAGWTAELEDRSAIAEMLDEEAATAVDARYLDYHGADVLGPNLLITPCMRLMTINWMSEAVYDLALDQRVVAMASLLLDRYLSATRQFPRTMLQLAAAAAIFIAAKIEGTLPHPRGSRIAALSDGAFELDELVAFERIMVQSIGFDLYGPTTQNFLDMWLHVLPPPAGAAEAYYLDKVYLLASYLLELASLVYDTLGRRRSILATAALLVALADPGLTAASAAALNVPHRDLASHAAGLARALPRAAGPAARDPEVPVAAAELLRLHRLAQRPENREQFVIVKFSAPQFERIALVAAPFESHAAFRAFMLYALSE